MKISTTPHVSLLRALIVALFLLGPAGSPVHAASEFISGFDDMPLMPGMAELPGELMTFDSPSGRIIENTVAGKVEKQAVEAFYRATLPQLGWAQTGPGVFVREDEILRLEFLAPGGVSSAPSSLTVHFILRPVEK